MDPEIFFLRKLSNEILETILVDEKNVTWTHIDLAKRKKWYPGITIHQYLKILKCWQIIFKLYNRADYDNVLNEINNIKELSNIEKSIFTKIINEWFCNKIILQATSINIEKYKLGIINVDNYINSFLKKDNPFKMLG